MIVNIGEGTSRNGKCIEEDTTIGSQALLIPNIKCITDLQEAVNFIYSHRFNKPEFQRRAILEGTNSEVDSLNSIIQKINPNINQKRHLLSAEKLAEVDDPRGILRDMPTSEVLNTFNNNGVPPNDLILCVGDIFIFQRNLCKTNGVTNNTRVYIVAINTYSMREKTLGQHAKTAAYVLNSGYHLYSHSNYEELNFHSDLHIAWH